MNGWLMLLPRDGAERMKSYAGTSGIVRFRASNSDGLVLIQSISYAELTLPVTLYPKNHPLNVADSIGDGGWFRVPADLHVYWYESARRGTGISFDGFTSLILHRLPDPGNNGYFVVTHAPDVDVDPYRLVPIPEFVAWHLTRQGAEPVRVEVEPDIIGVGQIDPHWPVGDLTGMTVMVVGVGSIGGAATTALAGYGVGRLRLVDPDRFLWHNLVRHVLPGRYVGRYKVDALREHLAEQRPDTTIEALRLDVVENADCIRPLLRDTDIVLCAADGVGARRAVSHLARRADREAVLACVLEDGGIGEIVRLRPWPDHGCLLCRRRALTEAGVIDPEPGLEAEYGRGTLHRPMTAVGADLHAMGDFAAKVTVASALERRGHADQRLPGENLIVALRAQRGWQAPFDLDRTGEIRWTAAEPPRADCPTCATDP